MCHEQMYSYSILYKYYEYSTSTALAQQKASPAVPRFGIGMREARICVCCHSCSRTFYGFWHLS